ncbi:MAG: integrase core domain-containing protein, partial [Pseudomonadota bacterium]
DWRQHYNTVRPHSVLGYRPPAPETKSPFPKTDPEVTQKVAAL